MVTLRAHTRTQTHPPPRAQVCAGAPSTCRLLLRAKADPQLGAPNSSPLYAACHSKVHGDLEVASKGEKGDGLLACAKVLIEARADVNAANPLGRTPLHAAAVLGAVPLVQLLLQSGADAAAVSSQGESAASLAIARAQSGSGNAGHHAVARLLHHGR